MMGNIKGVTLKEIKQLKALAVRAQRPSRRSSSRSIP